MVAVSLNSEMIKAGRIIVDGLLDEKIEVEAAFWIFSSDLHGWKLIVSSHQLASRGPKESYRLIQRLMSRLPEARMQLSPLDVSLISPDAPSVKAMRRSITVNNSEPGARYTGVMLDGNLIEDMYVYRLLPTSARRPSTSRAKFELYRDRAGEYRFRLKAGSGETILSSEGYKAKSSARNGIASVRTNAVHPERFVAKKTTSGKHRFNLTASNGQVIATSQSYSSEAASTNGMKSVAKNAPAADVDERLLSG